MIASPMKNQFIGSPPYREINGGEPMPPFLSRIPKARQKDTAKQWRTLRTNTKTRFLPDLLPRLKVTYPRRQ